MKRIYFFLFAALLAMPAIAPAQDAATTEQLNKLSSEIDVLIEAKDEQNKKIDDLASQVRDLQNQVSKPTGDFASADDVKQLADKLKEVDQKRQDDNEHVLQELQKLSKTLTSGSSHRSSAVSPPAVTAATPSTGSDKGYDYVVNQGDTLSAIVKAYREKNIKVTTQQVLAANPGLNPGNMRVGQKIFIPAPAQ